MDFLCCFSVIIIRLIFKLPQCTYYLEATFYLQGRKYLQCNTVYTFFKGQNMSQIMNTKKQPQKSMKVFCSPGGFVLECSPDGGVPQHSNKFRPFFYLAGLTHFPRGNSTALTGKFCVFSVIINDNKRRLNKIWYCIAYIIFCYYWQHKLLIHK